MSHKSILTQVDGENSSFIAFAKDIYNEDESEQNGLGKNITEYFESESIEAKIISMNRNSESNIGENSVSFGNNGSSSGKNSVTMGDSNTASAENSFAFGKNNIVNSSMSIALGSSNTINGANSIIIGDSNTISSDNCISIGNNNVNSASNSISLGIGLINSKSNQIILGKYNKDISSAVFVVGCGTGSETGNRKNAIVVTSDGNVNLADIYENGKKITNIYANSLIVSGKGNAITSLSLDSGKITANKDNTFITKEVFDEFKSSLIDNIRPVGSIYTSFTDTDPSEIFEGTTWEKLEGVFLLAASDDYPAESTGGESEVKLAIGNMPKHNHQVTKHSHTIPSLKGTTSESGEHKHSFAFANNVNDIATGVSLGTSTGYTANVDEAGAHTHTVTTEESETGAINPTTSYSGSGNAHNNMPPYIAVYMWKRIS